MGILDTNTNDFEYINAGHNPPIFHSKDGDIQLLRKGGLLLGFLEEPFKYEIGNIKIEEGDFITIFSDGVTEAQDIKGVEFGDDKLLNLVKSISHSNAYEILKDIVNEVRTYAHDTNQYDDITLVIIKGK